MNARRFMIEVDDKPTIATWAELAEANDPDTMMEIGALAVGEARIVGQCDRVERLEDDPVERVRNRLEAWDRGDPEAVQAWCGSGAAAEDVRALLADMARTDVALASALLSEVVGGDTDSGALFVALEDPANWPRFPVGSHVLVIPEWPEDEVGSR